MAQVTLSFRTREKGLLRDLSAGARVGDTLFVADDEHAGIDALDLDGDTWVYRERFPLGSLVSLPGAASDEADIEGMAHSDGWLWITGSHARTRTKVDDDAPKKAVRRLSGTVWKPNRFVMARVPVVFDKKGRAGLDARQSDRQTEQFEAGKRSSQLIRWLSEDAMLAPFLPLAAKENGLDIEGLAASGGALWIGLRGPVVRGHAVVLRLQVSGAKRGALKARKLEEGRRFRKFLLPLGGLGVRDLVVDGDDLLILTGPTMSAPGPAQLVRWRGARDMRDSQVVPEADLRVVSDLDTSHGNPEALIPWDDGRALLLLDGASGPYADRDKALMRADLIATHR